MDRVELLPTREDVDWEQWIESAMEGRVSSILFEAVRGTELVPGVIEDSLRQVYLQNAMRNTLLLDELESILNALTAEDVLVVPIKGAALIQTAYGSPAVRPMADLDILVSPARVKPALLVLKALGYVNSHAELWPGYDLRHRQASEFGRKAAGNFTVSVDLHWGLVDLPAYKRIPIDEILERSFTTFSDGVATSLPSTEDHLLCLCAHLSIHERYDPNLLRYCDLAAIIYDQNRALDWDTVLRRAVGWRLVIPLQRTLTKLNQIWPGMVPSGVVQIAAEQTPSRFERRMHRWVIDRPRTLSIDVLLSVLTTPRLDYKVRQFLEQAFPSPAYMRQRYNPRPSFLWPLSYLYRAGTIVKDLA